MAEIPLGTRKQELLPESDTQYFLRDAPTRVIFDVNSDGKATGWSLLPAWFAGIETETPRLFAPIHLV